MACIFGDVTKIQTTGASERTARQDKLTVKGVEASYKLAEHDLTKMDQYKSIIVKVARAKQMDPAVIAGIISRESRAGAILVNGWGDHGNGFGLMQFTGGSEKLDTDWKTILTIQQVPLNKSVMNKFDDVDKNYHTPRGAWNSEEHVTQGTEILIQSIQAIQKKFPSWPKEHQFKGGIAAYNFGPGNVRTYDGMDIGTPGDDYSNDVVARSQWFKRHGY